MDNLPTDLPRRLCVHFAYDSSYTDWSERIFQTKHTEIKRHKLFILALLS